MSANITIADELRRKLETMTGGGRTVDDMANEAIARYIRKLEQDAQWRDLADYGRETGKRSGFAESDIVHLVHETRR